MEQTFAALAQLVLPSTPSEFWTFVTGLGTLVVAFVAARGLRSLQLMKADMLTRALRDASECTVQRCEEFAREIIPANASILKALAGAKIPVFVKGAEEVRFDKVDAQELDRARAWRQSLPPELRSECIALLNRLEAWAMHFMHGLGDENLAYGPCAPVFCSMIVELYGVVLVSRASKAAGHYPNAVGLFNLWIGRAEEQERWLKQGDLLRELGELMERQVPHPAVPAPRPIGTKLADPRKEP